MVLFRLVDVGAELFAMTASCARARALAATDASVIEVADLFCCEERLRIAGHFRELFGSNDAALYAMSKKVLAGDIAWLEQGIVRAESVPEAVSGMQRLPRARAAASRA